MNGLDPSRYEILLHWTALAIYMISAILFLLSVVFKKEWILSIAMVATLLALLPHSVALYLRWEAAGHVPYMTRYEILSSTVWIVVLSFLVLGWRAQRLRATGMVVMPVSILLLCMAIFSNTEIKMLPPALRSIWLIIHVTSNALTAGAIIIAMGASILYLLKEGREGIEFYKRLPSLDLLDAYAYRFAGLAFVFWSITIASGAIWADEAWGRYWGWDPLETWSLITWLVYGLYLHLRRFWRWRGKKAAIMLTLCFIFSVLTLFILPFVVESLHMQYFK